MSRLMSARPRAPVASQAGRWQCTSARRRSWPCTAPSTTNIKVTNSSYFAFIIGKGGITIRTIEADYHVSLNVMREQEKIEVIGVKHNVDLAVEFLRSLIDENKEVENKEQTWHTAVGLSVLELLR